MARRLPPRQLNFFTMKKKLVQSDMAYTQNVTDLLHFLEQYPEEILNRKPPTGGWSAMQVVHHLIMSEELSMRYVQKKMSFEGKYEITGWTEGWRSFVLWTFLKLPFKFKAPAKIGGDDGALPGYSTKAETFERWHQIRSQWHGFIQNMPEDIAQRTVYQHPRAGKIGWLHMVTFFQTHLWRHRQQILRTLQ